MPANNNMASSAQEIVHEFGGIFAKLGDRTNQVTAKVLHFGQDETFRFMKRALEIHQHAVESIRECKNLPDLFRIQQEWLTQSASHCTAHTVRIDEFLRRIVAEVNNNGAEPAPSAALHRSHQDDGSEQRDRSVASRGAEGKSRQAA